MKKTTLLLATFFMLLLAAPGIMGQGAKNEGLPPLLTDRLAATDPMDKVKTASHCKVYQFKLAAGNMYMIDLKSREFDSFLRVEDASGTQLAADDDSGGNLDARIIFTPPRTDNYRIIATTMNGGAIGNFTLRIWSPAAASEDIVVSADLPLTDSFGGNFEVHGYVEYRFQVANQSSTASHAVTLNMPKGGSQFYGGHYLRSIKRTVVVGPKSTASVSLFQPNLPTGYHNQSLEVSIDGRETRDPVPSVALQQNRGPASNRGQYIQPGADFARTILAPSRLSQDLQNNVFKSAVGAPPPSRSGNFGTQGGTYRNQNYTYNQSAQFRPTSRPVALWSSHWLGYSQFDGVAMTAVDLKSAPAEVQAALRQYVECGGSLLIAGPYAVPPDWKRAQVSYDGLTGYFPGFGQCLVASEPDAAKWEPEQWRPIAAMWEQSARAWQGVLTPDEANRLFPVVANLRIPVRSLFIVMLIFAIVIGPVNIYVLTRKRRRIWLLWTVPVFSLLTCAAVAGFMFLSEGWSAHVRVQGITILDEPNQRATSVGWLGMYAPLTPADGLHFIQATESQGTEVTPHVANPRYTYRPGTGRVLDWSNDQHLGSGWLTPRVPAHFQVRTSEKRTEQVKLTRDQAGALSIVNGLGAPAAAIWLADEAGNIYTAAGVPAGGEAQLTRTGKRAADRVNMLRQGFADNWLTLVSSALATPEEYLRPGCYLAVLEASPFLEQGLRHAEMRADRSVVYGIMKTP